MAVPPLGAAFAARAVIDTAAYGRFLRAAWGDSTPRPSVFVELPVLAGGYWFTSVALLICAVGCLGASQTLRSGALAVAAWASLATGTIGQGWIAFSARDYLWNAGCWEGASTTLKLESAAFEVIGAALVAFGLLGLRKAKSMEWIFVPATGAMLLVLALVWRQSGEGEAFAIAHDAAGQVHRWASGGIWIATAGLLLRRIRLGHAAETRGAVVLSVLAAIAFALTRPMSHDAANTLPVGVETTEAPTAELPSLEICESERQTGETLTLDKKGFRIRHHGWEMGQPDQENFDILNTQLTRRREVFEYIELRNPGVSAPDVELDLQFPADRPMSDLAPVLTAILKNSVTRVHLVSVRHTSVVSWTKGNLERHLRCARSFTLAPDGLPLASFATWGDLAERLDKGEVRLAVP